MNFERMVVLFALASLGLVGVACSGEERIVTSFGDEADAAGLAQLEVSVENGELTVSGEEGLETVEVTVELVTARTSDAKDEVAEDNLHVEFRESGENGLRLSIWFDKRIAGYTANVSVSVPADLALSVETDDTDSLFEGIGALDLVDGAGELTIRGATGDVTVDDGAGDLLVEEVFGLLTVADGAGEIAVATVDGDVVIDDGAGNIDVAHVTGTVTIDDGGGDITVEDVGGLNIASDAGGTVTSS